MKNDSRIQIELAEARKSIESGNVRSMELYLSKAKRYAREVKEDISEEVAEILGIYYKNSIESGLVEVRRLAESGDVLSMINDLSTVKEYARKVEEDISQKVAEIEGIGYKNGLELELAEARKFAESGDASSMGINLLIAWKCATYLGEDISERVDKIEGIGYKNGLEPKLAEVRRFAESGEVLSMENHLSIAWKCATYLGENISERVDKIEGIGYKNGLELELAEARKFAESGDTLSMGNNLFIAQKCATYLREDISERVDEIERIGLKNGLEPDLAEARKFAVYGDASSMENYLNRAQEYATIIDEDISERVAEIRAFYKFGNIPSLK